MSCVFRRKLLINSSASVSRNNNNNGQYPFYPMRYCSHSVDKQAPARKRAVCSGSAL